MPYAFLNADGSIKEVVRKLSPFMKVLEGERIANYNPPAYDPELQTATPITPVPDEELDIPFIITAKDQSVYEAVHIRRKSALVQDHLDTTAQSMGYDNILSAVSYAGSGHPVYDSEGVAFKAWRSACWDVTFAVLDAAFAGNRDMPSDLDFISELPALSGLA
jgi:hypothetical protein